MSDSFHVAGFVVHVHYIPHYAYQSQKADHCKKIYQFHSLILFNPSNKESVTQYR